MQKKNSLSIIIVNYNVDSLVLNCINSIYKLNSNKKFEIIVVDNSEKNLLEKKLYKKFKSVKYIKSPENIGYGAGINLGAKNAIGNYLLVLNPDTEFISGKIDTLIKFAEKERKCGAVSPLILYKNRKPHELQGAEILTPKYAIFSMSILVKLIPKNKIYREFYQTYWDKKSIKKTNVIPGTAFLIKRSIYDEVGGFDENFFLYFEEFDFCKRLIDKGYENYINPNVKIFHAWGASTKLNKKRDKYFMESRFYYFKKHFGDLKAFITELILNINKYILTIVLIILFILIIFFLK